MEVQVKTLIISLLMLFSTAHAEIVQPSEESLNADLNYHHDSQYEEQERALSSSDSEVSEGERELASDQDETNSSENKVKYWSY